MALDDIITVNKKQRRGASNSRRKDKAKPYQKPKSAANDKAPLFTKGSKIIVSNLGFHVKSSDIKEIFAKAGLF